jgi:hypothetical protein
MTILAMTFAAAAPSERQDGAKMSGEARGVMC